MHISLRFKLTNRFCSYHVTHSRQIEHGQFDTSFFLVYLSHQYKTLTTRITTQTCLLRQFDKLQVMLAWFYKPISKYIFFHEFQFKPHENWFSSLRGDSSKRSTFSLLFIQILPKWSTGKIDSQSVLKKKVIEQSQEHPSNYLSVTA